MSAPPRSLYRRLSDSLFNTFRGRLAMLYMAVEFSVLLFAGVLLYVMLSHRIYASVDEQMQQQAKTLVTELERSPFRFWSQHLSEFTEHYLGSVQLVGANGIFLFSSDRPLIGRGGSEVTKALHQAMEGKVAFVSTHSLLHKGNIRVLAMPVQRAGRIIAVVILGRSMKEVRSFFSLMFLAGGVLGLFSMLISAYAGFVMARRALKPIDEITMIAQAVASGDLSQRLHSFSQDREIATLIRVLNKMFQDLESSFNAQKRFTADASHELRIPLTVMKGDIEVTLRRKRRASEYEQVLRQQLEIIERMQRIVDGLLTLARADAGLLELAREEIDLSLLLQEAGQHHLGLFASKNIYLDMQISDGLRVTGDSARLERVVFNLLNNAFKYAPEGSTVTLAARAMDHQAMVEVRDEGQGIAPEHLNRLFDRFYRADESRSRIEGGAGLGLAISKRIIEAHEGSIEAESKPGEGACFRFYLPLNGPDPGYTRRVHKVMRKTVLRRKKS